MSASADWPPPESGSGVLRRVRDVALTITAVGGAVATVYALLRFAGPMIAGVAVSMAAGAVASWLVWLIVRELRELRTAVALVERHLAPNGHEALLPEELREQPLRDVIAWAVRQIVDITSRLRAGDTWMTEHHAWSEREHTALARRIFRLEERHREQEQHPEAASGGIS